MLYSEEATNAETDFISQDEMEDDEALEMTSIAEEPVVSTGAIESLNMIEEPMFMPLGDDDGAVS